MTARTSRIGDNLTPRHLELLGRFALGQTQRGASKAMGVSEAVVKNLTRTLLEDLGATNNAHAVGLGIGLGLLPADASINPTTPPGGRHGSVR